MGSGKHCKSKSQITMAEEKKSIISTCKNAFKWFKGKGKESKETKNDKHAKKEEKIVIQQPKVTPVAELLEKLEIEKRKEKDEEEDEMGNFSRKLIDVDKSCSIDSHSSLDSGYTDKDDKDTDELTSKLQDLKIESQSSVDSGFTENAETDKEVTLKKDGETKEDLKDKKGTKDKKKTKTVVLHRGPDRHNRLDSFYPSTHPYAHRQDEYKQTTTSNHGEIQSQVNKHTLSGGRVIVNDSKEDNLILAQAVIRVDQNVQKFSNSSPDEQEDHLLDAMELVKDLNQETFLSISDDFNLPVFSPEATFAFDGFRYEVQPPDTILPQYPSDDSQSQLFPGVPDGFPTPPRSEYVPSPSMSDLLNPSGSPSSFASPPYGLSNPSPLPLNPEWEQFGIVNYEPIPEPTELSQSVPESPISERKHTLKYYKDMQKEIANQFKKKECCQNRRSCKEIFQKHMQKLSKDDRKNIYLKVAKLDQKDTYGVLCYILMELSQHSDNEDMQMSIFELICEKVLAQNPELFFDKFGLNLIKLAALRCFARPLLTRYLVQCVRVALKTKGETKTDTHIFDELDAQGDNLLHACVRLGDVCADALSELVRKDVGEAPLFDIHHHNSDGYLPLHLACSAHSAGSPRAHCAHALLDHGAADLWRWDRKGGETSVHLAVNSGTCDLALVMQLFRHVERKDWKRLAHYRNRGLLTPLEYARTAARSPTRTNYPVEVLEFLQKCR